ncbi:uncharacterized protein LOC141602150 [Silene latifolia]|uniref:uncharacterized protein LOC141602150 n=1 Tax=Silene latifolia TaxID=37657 RepID=UPI003D784C67
MAKVDNSSASGTYNIEFQKRWLSHAHILIFLHRDDKFSVAANVDKIISAEIPDPDENPLLYALVKENMIHSPCGKDFPTCPCMVASKCSRNFPKRCIESTMVDDDEYPAYTMREKRFTVVKSGRKNLAMRGIKPGSDLAELLIRTKLIIWDEAPMTHIYAFEAVDRSLRNVMRFSNDGDTNQPFGGKVVVFGGDFRQVLPVISKGSRSEIVNASLCASNLWSTCKVLKLTKNMRFRGRDSCSELAQIKEFSEWILKVGDGVAGDPNDGKVELELLNDILIHWRSYRVDYGTKKIYFSSDEVSRDESNTGVRDLYSTKFLNSIKCLALPNHELKLKVGAVVMLLRNIDQSRRLCNDTRLIVADLGSRVIRATVLSGSSHKGDKVHIAVLHLLHRFHSEF